MVHHVMRHNSNGEIVTLFLQMTSSNLMPSGIFVENNIFIHVASPGT